MIGRFFLTATLLVLLAGANLGPHGSYSQWQWYSPNAYEVCVEAGHPLLTDGWGEQYPWVEHPAFVELQSPVMVQHLFPRYDVAPPEREAGEDSLEALLLPRGDQWQVAFYNGTTSIYGSAQGTEPLDVSVLDRLVADLGFEMSDVVLWNDEPNRHSVGRTTRENGEQVWKESVELREHREYRVAGYPDLEALLDRNATGLHIADHHDGHSIVSALAGPWVWHLTAPDCILRDEQHGRLSIGPDGHGRLSGERRDRGEALQVIQSALHGRITVAGLAPPPGMQPS